MWQGVGGGAEAKKPGMLQDVTRVTLCWSLEHAQVPYLSLPKDGNKTCVGQGVGLE